MPRPSPRSGTKLRARDSAAARALASRAALPAPKRDDATASGDDTGRVAPDRKVMRLVHLDDQPGKLAILGGSKSDDFNNILANQVSAALWKSPAASPADLMVQDQAAAAALMGIKPTSEIEGMLAAQMIALHSASMDAFRRAMIPEQPAEYRADLLGLGIKASRAYADLVAALDKHRGKGGEQRMTVEHVHVYPGGQAIVGNVTGGSGGQESKSNGQAHESGSVEG